MSHDKLRQRAKEKEEEGMANIALTHRLRLATGRGLKDIAQAIEATDNEEEALTLLKKTQERV